MLAVENDGAPKAARDDAGVGLPFWHSDPVRPSDTLAQAQYRTTGHQRRQLIAIVTGTWLGGWCRVCKG